MAAEPLQLTPSQTVGPFFGFALPWPDGPFVVREGTDGAVRVSGRILDGEGAPVPDALVETWQADPEGRYPDDPNGFRGFARAPTDDEGRFTIVTVKPGPTPGPDGATQAPHLAMSVFARGLLQRVVTRVYFPDEAEANVEDPVLSRLRPEQRDTLVAVAEDGGLRFDICLQGPSHTTFFAV